MFNSSRAKLRSRLSSSSTGGSCRRDCGGVAVEPAGCEIRRCDGKYPLSCKLYQTTTTSFFSTIIFLVRFSFACNCLSMDLRMHLQLTFHTCYLFFLFYFCFSLAICWFISCVHGIFSSRQTIS